MNQVAAQGKKPQLFKGSHRLTPVDWRDAWGAPIVFHTPAVVGRGSKADLHIADQWVSRVHCRLTEEEGALMVTDLDSRHGVFVNDERVARAKLHPGDLLQIGGSRFCVDLRDDDSGSDLKSGLGSFPGE